LGEIKILFIEDEVVAAGYICEFLEDEGFVVDYTDTITSGLANLKNKKYDLLLLDLSLPDFTGFDLLQNIKNNTSLPIIVTSAYNDTKTKVKAFRYGVSDYMVKPIDLEELLARIWALLGRFSSVDIEFDKELFYIQEDSVFFKSKPIDLTTTEFEIFKIFIENRNKTVSREQLTQKLSTTSSSRSLDPHIKNIRKKIDDYSSKPKYLKTEYGFGYKLSF
jgi:DNA-binding response OmpR family regulator